MVAKQRQRLTVHFPHSSMQETYIEIEWLFLPLGAEDMSVVADVEK